MKTVFNTNDQVAHIWAQQKQSDGRAGNLYFEGATIYSYGPHYPIARFTGRDVPSMPGEQIVLLNSNGSSKTTEGRHKPAVRDALHGLNVRLIRVNNVRAMSVREHTENVRHLREAYDVALTKAGRARVYAHGYLNSAGVLRADAIVYSAVFDLPPIDWPEVSEETAAAARAKAAAISKAEAAERAAKMTARRAEYDARIKAWMAGEDVSPHAPYELGPVPTRLRLKGKSVIQTSRGAEVPRSVAFRLWKQAQSAVRGGVPYYPVVSGEADAVGHFHLHHISADGALHIGCHVIEFGEVQRFATEVLGFDPMPQLTRAS